MRSSKSWKDVTGKTNFPILDAYYWLWIGKIFIKNIHASKLFFLASGWRQFNLPSMSEDKFYRVIGITNDAPMGPRKLQKQKSTEFSIQHNRWDWVKNKIKRFNNFFQPIDGYKTHRQMITSNKHQFRHLVQRIQSNDPDWNCSIRSRWA